jgi:hypothetical protein
MQSLSLQSPVWTAATTNTWTGWRPLGKWADWPPQVPKRLDACFQGGCLAPRTPGASPCALGPLYPWSPGELGLVKTPISGSLDPLWEGPYQVILTTPSALKVAGLKPWIHHMHTKPVEDPCFQKVKRELYKLTAPSVLCQALVLSPLGIAQAQRPADGPNWGPLP